MSPGEAPDLAARRAAIQEERELLRFRRGYRERTVGTSGTLMSLVFAAGMIAVFGGLGYLTIDTRIPQWVRDALPWVMVALFFAGLFGVLRWQYMGTDSFTDLPEPEPVLPEVVNAGSEAVLRHTERRLRLARCAEPRVVMVEMDARRIRLFGRSAVRTAAFAKMSDPVGGRLLDHAGAMMWLNDNWAAESSTDELIASTAECAVSFTLQGFPVLIDVEPDGMSDESDSCPPRALVYVAALVPAGFAGTPQGTDLRAALAREGFELVCVPDAGFLCRADESTRAAYFTDAPPLGRLQAAACRVVDAAGRATIPPPT